MARCGDGGGAIDRFFWVEANGAAGQNNSWYKKFKRTATIRSVRKAHREVCKAKKRQYLMAILGVGWRIVRWLSQRLINRSLRALFPDVTIRGEEDESDADPQQQAAIQVRSLADQLR